MSLAKLGIVPPQGAAFSSEEMLRHLRCFQHKQKLLAMAESLDAQDGEGFIEEVQSARKVMSVLSRSFACSHEDSIAAF